MNEKYPRAFPDIGGWAKANKVTVQEARARFAQYGILRAVSDSRQLSAKLVLKGGNALDFVWSPNRSTKDLDFTSTDPLEGDELRDLLQESLAATGRKLGTLYRVHSVKRQPPAPDATFVTYAVSVGYALTDEAPLRKRLEGGQTSPLVIPLDVSLNEVVCEDEPVDTAGVHKLRVSSREDIVAEKLRSLLQQPVRNRYRRQDLLDIAVTRRQRPLDADKVADFLRRKSAARNIVVSRAAFRDPEVKRRAAQDYDGLASTTRTLFVAFDDAWSELLALLDALPIDP